MDSLLKEIGQLQSDYQSLVDKKVITKRAICQLCVPFRDKYKLTGSQTLQIARRELSIYEIGNLLENEGKSDEN